MPIGGQNTQRVKITRIELRNGKFMEWIGVGQAPRTYDWVQGVLCGITTREQRMTDGRVFVYCDTHLVSDDGERFCISTIASSAITGDIVSRLINVKDYKDVLLFSAWQNGNFTNIAIREKKSFDATESEKIPWVDIPRPKKIQSGFNQMMDSSERDNAVMILIGQINGKLTALGLNRLQGTTGQPAPETEVKNEEPEPPVYTGTVGYVPGYIPQAQDNNPTPPPEYYQ